MAKTNWQGPVVGGLVGVGHFVLWLVIASTLTAATGDDKWEYWLGGFNLITSVISGFVFGCLPRKQPRAIRSISAVWFAGFYAFIGYACAEEVPDQTLFWMLVGAVGIPMTAGLWLWSRRLPVLSAAEVMKKYPRIPPELLRNPLETRKLSTAILLAMALTGLSCAVGGFVFCDSHNIHNTPVATRFVMGGGCLLLSAIVGFACLQTWRTGKVPMCSFKGYYWLDRSQSPTRFWLYILMFGCLTVAMAWMSLVGFAGGFEDLNQVR